MDELLIHLENQIKELIGRHAGLKNSHKQLDQHSSQLTREKEWLLSKQKKAITQIESLVAKLKAIEKLP